MTATDDRSKTDDRGRRFFEETIRRLRPGSKFSWGKEEKQELHIVSISRSGVRVKLEITEEALDQATDDPASHHRLAREVGVQLRLSESGERVGRVTEV